MYKNKDDLIKLAVKVEEENIKFSVGKNEDLWLNSQWDQMQ